MKPPIDPRLSSVVEELKKRRVAPFRLEDCLFDKQLAFVLDPAPFKLGVTTRRAGKSFSCGHDLVDTCDKFPGVICLYITLSRKNAKRLIWPELKKINKKYNLGAVPNESDLSLTFPNDSILHVLGAKDRTAIEDFRGLAIKKVYLDEAQSFPSYIRELIDDVIGPALMDYAGTLCLIGTPGPVPAGYFYDLTTNKEWSQHNWSFFDNPHIPLKAGKTHQEIFERELKRRGVGPEDPSIQREWYGKWVLDADSLVYKYKAERNHYEELPKDKLSYILGVDLGFDDADALAVLGWSDSSPVTYVVEELVTRKQGISELVSQIEFMRNKYEISKVVVDTGGLGKKIGEELSRRYKIAIIPAEKQRKAEYIELMNDALRTSNLMAKATSLFAHDAMKVEWDRDKSTPDKMVISNRFHSDICEAVLYAWRESYSFTHSKTKTRSKVGTEEWYKEEADAMEAEAEEFFKKAEELEKEWPDGEL